MSLKLSRMKYNLGKPVNLGSSLKDSLDNSLRDSLDNSLLVRLTGSLRGSLEEDRKR